MAEIFLADGFLPTGAVGCLTLHTVSTSVCLLEVLSMNSRCSSISFSTTSTLSGRGSDSRSNNLFSNLVNQANNSSSNESKS